MYHYNESLRNKFSKKGLKQASKFSYAQGAAQILDLYNKVRPQIENGSVVLFEGGSDVRPGFDLAKEKTNYKVLTDNIKYSLSIIYDESKWSLGY